jgi:hypothetical protein
MGFVAMRTNTSASYAWTVGVSQLPTNARACVARVATFDPGMRLRFKWIADRCSPKRFPWFRDEFIHPNDFDDRYTGPPLLNLFEGFVGFGTESNEPREWGVKV